MTFRHNVAYMVKSFLVSSEIPVMILYKLIKILHEKMLVQYICIDSITMNQRNTTHEMVIPTNLK